MNKLQLTQLLQLHQNEHYTETLNLPYLSSNTMKEAVDAALNISDFSSPKMSP